MFSLTYEDLIQRIRPYFAQTILKRGWLYYKDDTVEQFQVESETVVKATVHGSLKYAVKLDLKQFRNSRCNCPHDEYCKHMAAVLYETCYRAGLQPKQLLSPQLKLIVINEEQEAEGGALHPDVPPHSELEHAHKEAAPASAKAVESSHSNQSIASRNSRITTPKESGTAAEWHRYFEKQFPPLSFGENSRHEIEGMFTDITDRLLPYASAWESTARMIYGIHVVLFTMKRVDELRAEIISKYYYRVYAFNPMFNEISEQCIQVLYDMTKRVNQEQAQSMYLNLLEETAEYLAEHAFPEQLTLMCWQDAYSKLWRDLLYFPALVEKERKRITASLDNPRMFVVRKNALVVSLALFDVLEGQDQRAFERFEQQLGEKNSSMLFSFLEHFYGSREWDRLVVWLRWLVPWVKKSGTSEMEVYFHYWMEAAKHRELKQEWQNIVCSMLPESYPFYSGFLFQQQRFHEWVDLNIIFMRSPLNFSAAELKQVEVQDGRLLLPMYHFAVERSILEKNRASYKTAVRILKKLHALYKRLKELDRWEPYIEQVSKQYSRYRAFQEELRKGKLL